MCLKAMIPNTNYAHAHTHIHNSLGDTQTGVFLFVSYRGRTSCGALRDLGST